MKPNNHYIHYKETDGRWTALVSLNGLEVITSSPNCRNLWRRMRKGERFIMKIRPLVEGIDCWVGRLNALRNISKEVAFQGLDFLIAQQLIEIVWMTCGDAERDKYIDEQVRLRYGVVFDR